MFSSFMNARNAGAAPPSPAITSTTVGGINTPETTDSEATLNVTPSTNSNNNINHISMSDLDQLLRLHGGISQQYERQVMDSVHSAGVKVNVVTTEVKTLKDRVTNIEAAIHRLVDHQKDTVTGLQAAIGPLFDEIKIIKESYKKEPVVALSTPNVKSDRMVSRTEVTTTLFVVMVIAAIIGAFWGAKAYGISFTMFSIFALGMLFPEEKVKPAAKK